MNKGLNRVISDSVLVILLLSILVLPITSLGIIRLEGPEGGVLSIQNESIEDEEEEMEGEIESTQSTRDFQPFDGRR